MTHCKKKTKQNKKQKTDLWYILYLACCYVRTIADRQYSVSLSIMSVHLSAFADFINVFIRHSSRHHTLELLINFINVCSEPALCILSKFDTGFFSSCNLTSLVNMT